MQDTEKSEKKDSSEEDGKASVNTVNNAKSWSVHVSGTEEHSKNFFLDEGAASTHSNETSESHLSIPVQETESLNLLRSTDEPASSSGETLEAENLPIPFQEKGSSNILTRTDEPTSPFLEDKPHAYSSIPVSLPPADECQLCARKFWGSFRQFNVIYCQDCSRYRDFVSCNTKDYKRSSGPPMSIF